MAGVADVHLLLDRFAEAVQSKRDWRDLITVDCMEALLLHIDNLEQSAQTAVMGKPVTDLDVAKVVLQERALRYARLKTFGVVLRDNGSIEPINETIRKDHEELFMRELSKAAISLLLEMTLPPRESPK